MKKFICEMCGGSDLLKQDGVFICQSCGCKYSVEEAKKILLDGTVDAPNNEVKSNPSNELENLYQIARRAKNDDNRESAAKYYDMILLKDPSSWEASFYTVYFKATTCTIAEIPSAGMSVSNCIGTVFELIKNNIASQDEQKEAYTEVANRVLLFASMLFEAAKNHYNEIDFQIRFDYMQEWLNNSFSAINCIYTLGDNLDLFFNTDTYANELSAIAWEEGVSWHKSLMGTLGSKEENRNIINSYISKIKKYDNSYVEPAENKKVGGCYIATAIYGSYDCPQVWTLRRFRDYTLAKTWYGRVFIHVYYKISPVLVKQFGQTRLFKKIWKSKLDCMVKNLNSKGIKDTPYED